MCILSSFLLCFLWSNAIFLPATLFPLLFLQVFSPIFIKLWLFCPHFLSQFLTQWKDLYIASNEFCSLRIANTISQPPTICGCYCHGFHGNISRNIFAISYCLFSFLCLFISHSEELESFWKCWGFFLVYTMCLLPSFIFNYFYFYNIPCLLAYLKILAVSQPMNYRKRHRNAEEFLFALSLHSYRVYQSLEFMSLQAKLALCPQY